MAPAESTAGFAAKKSWGRGSGRDCTRSSYAWPKCHWQDEYVITPTLHSFFSKFVPSIFFFSAKTIEIDALRFQDKDLNVIGTLEYGQFGVVCLLLLYSSVTC